jgi:hypothetical protein
MKFVISFFTNIYSSCVFNYFIERPSNIKMYFYFSDNGIVMTCGDGSFGALGHGDWNSVARPKLIEQLLR